MDQLLLFEEPLEGKLLREVAELKISLSKVRKGQFAKIGELKKEYEELKSDMEIIKRGLCHMNQTSPCEILQLAVS